jgi:hypothetical protein
LSTFRNKFCSFYSHNFIIVIRIAYIWSTIMIHHCRKWIKALQRKNEKNKNNKWNVNLRHSNNVYEKIIKPILLYLVTAMTARMNMCSYHEQSHIMCDRSHIFVSFMVCIFCVHQNTVSYTVHFNAHP